MIIKERTDGAFHTFEQKGDSKTFGFPFEKDSEKWNEMIEEGCEVEYLPQAEKDAYKAQQEREAILMELSALDAHSYKIERALAGDQQAIDDIKANEAKKNELRAKL